MLLRSCFSLVCFFLFAFLFFSGGGNIVFSQEVCGDGEIHEEIDSIDLLMAGEGTEVNANNMVRGHTFPGYATPAFGYSFINTGTQVSGSYTLYYDISFYTDQGYVLNESISETENTRFFWCDDDDYDGNMVCNDGRDSYPMEYYPSGSDDGYCDYSNPSSTPIIPNGCFKVTYNLNNIPLSYWQQEYHISESIRNLTKTTVYEECDDGGANNGTNQAQCGSSAEICDACSCVSTYCGDGVVQTPNGNGFIEQCDDGNTNNNDACRNDCTTSSCGDGVVDSGEQCDDGNTNNDDACTTTCEEADCGDGLLQNYVGYTEECDDGNIGAIDGSDDGCDHFCTVVNVGGICGDNVQDPGEECDDGNTNNYDSCDNTCKLVGCGDGVVQSITFNTRSGYSCAGACKRGSANAGQACSADKECGGGAGDCLLRANLDGGGGGGLGGGGGNYIGYCAVDSSPCNEDNECQNHTLDQCVTPEEICPGGNSGCFGGSPNGTCEVKYGELPSTCASDCSGSILSSGYIEECDDGNIDNTDTCNDECKLTECRDNVIQSPNGDGEYEICDGTSGCNNTTCQLAIPTCSILATSPVYINQTVTATPTYSAGSSFVVSPIDRGDGTTTVIKNSSESHTYAVPADYEVEFTVSNIADTDIRITCKQRVSVLHCGDGIWQGGFNEECDASTGCKPNTCTCNMGYSPDGAGNCVANQVCGDGTEEGIEECDDGNLISGDGCSATCLDEVCTTAPGSMGGVLEKIDNLIFGVSDYSTDINGDTILDTVIGAVSDISLTPPLLPTPPFTLAMIAVKSISPYVRDMLQVDDTGLRSLIANDTRVGSTIENMLDLYNDGTPDIGLAAYYDESGGEHGSAWVVYDYTIQNCTTP